MVEKSVGYQVLSWLALLVVMVILQTIIPGRLLAASTPYLVQDLNQVSTQSTTFPATQAVTEVNGVYFYVRNDVPHGNELWKTDGTSAGTMLVKDIFPGSGNSDPSSLVNFNGTLFFLANDGINGQALWKSDGTETGTVVVKNIGSTQLVVMGNSLYFIANDALNSFALWKSDGTGNGTQVVKNIGSNISYISQPIVANDRLYFMTASSTYDLWVSDGTTSGTGRVRTNGASMTNFKAVNSILFFTASDTTNGNELWKSDGTPGGTTLVKNINPLAANSNPSNLTNVNGALFFTANDGIHGVELWKSDGTLGGTVLVKDINPLTANSNPSNLTNVNGTLFFTANDGTHGVELWKSDGTAGGTVLVKDIYAGSTGSSPTKLTVMGTTLYFRATDSAHGTELWKSDGTDAGTILVKDIYSGSGSSYPAYLKIMNGLLYMWAQDSYNIFHVWQSNGTSSGTILGPDIHYETGSSSPSLLTGVNGTLYFTADVGWGQQPLYKSDSTASGTTTFGAFGSTSPTIPTSLTKVDGTLFFLASDNGSTYQLWKTDGTDAGTLKLVDPLLNEQILPQSLVDVNGTLFFFKSWLSSMGGFGTTIMYELWKSTGAVDGTTVVFPGLITSSYIMPTVSNLTNVNGVLFYLVSEMSPPILDGCSDPRSSPTGCTGPALWKSDGLTNELVKQFPVSTAPSSLTAVNNTLYFVYDDGISGSQLWMSDGTDPGTVMVKNINSNPGGAIPQYLTNVNGTLFFAADDGVHGLELWKSDGTDAGTIMVRDIADGNNGTVFTSLVNVNGALYFSANDSVNGQELWTSNGTDAGTFMVKDIFPGGSSTPSGLVNLNGTLYFSANDGVHGEELWASDGSAAGTRMVADLYSGSGGSAPGNLTAVNNILFFTAYTADNGRELWALNTGGSLLRVNPDSVAFGVTNIMAPSSPQYVTISNLGETPLVIASIAVTGPNAADNTLFTLSASSCGTFAPTVAAGGSCTAAVTFAPAAAGDRTSYLTITPVDSAISPVSVRLTGTGFVPTMSLSVTKDGSGSGFIAMEPFGSLNPSTNQYEFPYGETVVLTATADTGSELSAWTGCDTVSANKCTVKMNDYKSVNATFIKVVSVTVQTSPDGRAFMVDGVSYASAKTLIWEVGTPHNLSATTPQPVDADHNYLFMSWNGGSIMNSSTPNQTVLATEGGSGYFVNYYNEYEPFISGITVPTSTAGVFYSFTPTVTNPKGDPVSGVTYSISNKPSWATFNLFTGKLSGTPGLADTGVYNNIVITAQHGVLSAEMTFSVTITAPVTGELLVPRYHQTATMLTDGKVLIAGGVSGYGSLLPSAAELYDPVTGSFSPSGYLASGRWGHTATLLPNGKVLIAGGVDQSGFVGTAELYDPVTGTFRPTGNPNFHRSLHTATLLANGKVLLVGGSSNPVNGISLSQAVAELYDPATGIFTPTGSMQTATLLHRTTLLADGTVLISGGVTNNSSVVRVERYDPATGRFTAAGVMTGPRSFHSATLLPNGKVFIAGGYDSSTELYDPATKSSTASTPLTVARSGHSATLLPDGTVVIAGGGLKSVERYTPDTSAVSAAGELATPRGSHSATLLANGAILIAGGTGPDSRPVAATERLEFFAGSFSATAANLPAPVAVHTATLLPTGNVLIAGGLSGGSAVTQGEIYDPVTDIFGHVDDLSVARSSHRATLLATGQVLITGGGNATAVALDSAELYDAQNSQFSPTGAMTVARTGHTATLLGTGQVLLTGGRSAAGRLKSSELYKPSSGTFVGSGELLTARADHTATLLPNGKVLITGGMRTDNALLASAELYDPGSGSFTAAGDMGAARSGHTATLLLNGKILVAGGATAGAELYDPVAGHFTATGAMALPRSAHTATLLPNGKVLIAGGGAGAELYDPATGLFTATGVMSTVRVAHTATLLLSGRILVAGGASGGNQTATAEVYTSGLTGADASRPQLTGVSLVGSTLILSGRRLTGVAEGSSGAYNGSPTNFPLVRVMRLDNEQQLYLPSDPTAFWSAAAVVSNGGALAGLPAGPYLVTVQAGGTPSYSLLVVPNATVVPVVIRTAPGGRTTIVDDVVSSFTQTYFWDVGSSHTLAAPVLQQGANPGEWYEFTGWNDGGASAHSITVSQAGTVYLASFVLRQMPSISGTPAAVAGYGVPYTFVPLATDAASFTIANKPAWATFNTVTGALTGTPGAANIGTTGNIVITAINGPLSAALPSFSITVYGQPTISGTPATTVDQGAAYSFTPTATNTVQFAIANKPAWATFDTATGRLYGTPDASGVGTTNGIVITAINGTLTAALPSFKIMVYGQPTISGAPASTIIQDTPYSFTPTVTNTTGFTIANKPTWATFNATTGLLSGTPRVADVGTTVNIVITAVNGGLSTSLPPFSIRVYGQPTITGRPAYTAPVGKPYLFTPVAATPNGTPLSFSITGKPSWLSFDPVTGVLKGTPAISNYGPSTAITISVSDGILTAALPAFTVDVYTLGAYFTPHATSQVTRVIQQPDGKILATGNFATPAGGTQLNLGRLFIDGSLDTSFQPLLSAFPATVALQTDGKVLIGGTAYLRRLNADGSLDSTFGIATNGAVSQVAVQQDNKILVTGDFTILGGQPRHRIGRLSPDGTLDASFNPGADALVYRMLVQPDGKILVSGLFTTIDGQSQARLARLNADGTLDSSFTPLTDPSVFIETLAVQTDGRILAGGSMTVNGANGGYLARFAGNGSTDATFNPGLDGFPPSIFTIKVQPDGRIIVGGDFTILGGMQRLNLGRLSSTGAIDVTFNPCPNNSLSDVLLQADGRIVVAGNFDQIGGQSQPNLARLNDNGTLDAVSGAALSIMFDALPGPGYLTYTVDGVTYNNNQAQFFTWDEGSTHTIATTVLQEGNPGFQHSFNNWSDGGASSHTVTATSAMTSYTAMFTVHTTPTIDGNPNTIVDQGKLYTFTPIATNALRFEIVNRPTWANFDSATGTLSGAPGSADAEITTSNIVITAINGNYRVSMLPFSIRVYGQPTFENRPTGIAKEGYSYTYSPTVTHTSSFSIINKPAWATFNTSTGLLSGIPGIFDVGTTGNIYIFAYNGGLQTSLGAFSITVVPQTPASLTISSGPSRVDEGTTGTYVATATWNFGDPGDVVATWSVDPATYATIDGNGYLTAKQVPYDQTVTVTATYTRAGVTKTAAKSVTIVNLTTYFTPNATSDVVKIVEQTDGKILAVGSFAVPGGGTQLHLARLHVDGSLDTSFLPLLNAQPSTVALQADGKVLVGGTSNTIGTRYLARLNGDGTLDGAFTPNSNGAVQQITVQPDGKILVAGSFTTLAGQPRNRIGRLNADGTLDAAFNPGVDALVYRMAIQPQDQKILISGLFTTIAGQSQARLARLNADGTLDTSFTPSTDPSVFIETLALQSDGMILAGGSMTVKGASAGYLARFTGTGTLDASFNPGLDGYPATVYSLKVLSDGRIVVGGDFTLLDGKQRFNIGRLSSAGVVDDTFNPCPGGVVSNLIIQADDRIIVAGGYLQIGGQHQPNLARLNSNGVLDAVPGAALSIMFDALPGPGYLTYTVDTVTYNNNQPQFFTWNPGSTHTIATTILQEGNPGFQHSFSNWSDDGASSHTVTATSAMTTYAAIFAVHTTPTISGNPDNSVDQGKLYTFTPTATNALGFEIVNRPTWANFDSATGTLSGIPGAADAEITTSTIVITAVNGNYRVSMIPFSIRVFAVHITPTISGNPDNSVDQGKLYTFTPTATDALGFEIVNRPTWANFDSATGTLSGIPGAVDAEITTSNIVITAINGNYRVSMVPFFVRVYGQPTFTNSPGGSVNEGFTYAYSPTVPHTSSFSIINKPAWATFNTTTGLLSGTPGMLDVGTTSNIFIFAYNGGLQAALPAFSITVVPQTPTSLTISSGPSSINEATSAIYTATATWNFGAPYEVGATWSVDPATYATIGPIGGYLTTKQVPTDQTVTVTATYTRAGVTQTASKSVTIVNIPLPIDMTISGPSTVNELTSATYSATVAWDEGNITPVIPTWSVVQTTIASIDSNGVLKPKTIFTDQFVTITASYTSAGVIKTASKVVTIVNVQKPANLVIIGPLSVNELNSATYTAMLAWDDGSTETVTPAWSVSPITYVSIDTTGLLSAQSVSGDQQVTITASFTVPGGTITTSRTITIANVPFAVTRITPAAGSIGIPLTSTITATFSEPVDLDTISASTLQFSQRLSVTAIAAGGNHTIALQEGGTVAGWGWGDNIPMGLTGVTGIATGEGTTLVLKDDGTVATWGSYSNGYTCEYYSGAWGQQYTDCYVAYISAAAPAGLVGVRAIAANWSHMVALKLDGTVVAWGNDLYGKTKVPADLTGVIAIAAGGEHTVALKMDGSVVAWGDNTYGQAPVPTNLLAVKGIAAGLHYTVALKEDGTVAAWGEISNGYTCNKSYCSDVYNPVTVPDGLSGVTAIAAGPNHIIALKEDGTVVAWGDNRSGQTTVPKDLAGVKAIAAGSSHSVALKQDGTVTIWGDNLYGQKSVPENINSVLVNGSVSYDAETRIAMLTPLSSLFIGATYSMTIFNVGNLDHTALVIPKSWSFTTLAAPGISGNPSVNAQQGLSYTFSPKATNAAGFIITINGSSTLPKWMSFDSATGALGGTPGNGDAGIYRNIVITAVNSSGSAPLPPFSITVVATIPTAAVTVQTSPAGLGYQVDGDSYLSPQTFTWEVGSIHTITVTSPHGAVVSGSRYSYTGWSDGGAISHTITVPGSPATYTANFALEYQITSAVIPVDGGVVSPASGNFCPAGTTVTVSAVPDNAHAFTSWSGSVADSFGATTTVIMNGPVSITANLAAKPTHTLVVSLSGNGADTVALSTGGSYSVPFTTDLIDGTLVSLTAQPDAGRIFTGWTGCDSSTGVICTVTMDATRTVTAAFDALQSAPAAAGKEVVVTPTPEVAMTFPSSTGGTVTVKAVSVDAPLPGTFKVVDGASFQITTTAVFTGAVTICINYNPATITSPESALKLFHYTSTVWEELVSTVNITTKTVCGTTTSLSPFAIGQDQNSPPPTVRIDGGPSSPNKATSATFAFSSTEAGATFICSLDTAPWIPCAAPYHTGVLLQGNHSFHVKTFDPMSFNATPAVWTWTIDATPPATTITVKPPATTTQTSGSFSFSANERGSTFDCKLDSGAFTLCPNPVTLSNLASGAHTFTVRARDLAGNLEPNPPNYSWTIIATTTVTVTTIPTGRSFTVDGAAYTGSRTFIWDVGSSHPLAVTSPQDGGSGIQYVFSSWSDGGTQSHPVSPVTPTTYTATFTTNYTLSSTVTGAGSVASGDGIVCSGPSSSGSCSQGYPSGAKVTLTAAVTNSVFSGWGGACAPCGNTLSCPVTVDRVKSCSAAFAVPLPPSLITVSGSALSYDTLQLAYAAAGNLATIKARTASFTGDLLLATAGKTVTLKGGYEPTFATQTGFSTLQGKLTIGKGGLVADRVVVR